MLVVTQAGCPLNCAVTVAQKCLTWGLYISSALGAVALLMLLGDQVLRMPMLCLSVIGKRKIELGQGSAASLFLGLASCLLVTDTVPAHWLQSSFAWLGCHTCDVLQHSIYLCCFWNMRLKRGTR